MDSRCRGLRSDNQIKGVSNYRGPVRALMAIAHKLLVAAFHMLATGKAFRDLGEGYLDQISRRRSTAKLVQRLSNLGYEVTLVPKAA